MFGCVQLMHGADGSVTERMTFDEALPHHVRYVLWIVRDLDHFSKSVSNGMREYLTGLHPGYLPPCRATCYKLMYVIQGLIMAKIQAAAAKVREEVGEPCFGATSDLWSLKNAKESFACMRLTMIVVSTIVLPGNKQATECLKQVSPVVAFSRFRENHHTGHAIARWTKGVVIGMALTLACISVFTGDGAANNVKALKLLRVPFQVCAPHNLQRAVLKAVGMSGAKNKSSNPQVRALIRRNGNMTRSFHVSTVANKRLADAQEARGVAKKDIRSATHGHLIRWGGIYRSISRSRHLESDIKVFIVALVLPS
jgi:hypothetical protein